MKYKNIVTTLLTVAGFGSASIQNTWPTRVISANVNRVKGILNRSFNSCVGARRTNEGLRADWQRQLRIAYKESCLQHRADWKSSLTCGRTMFISLL